MATNLLSQTLNDANLFAAWERVRRNKGSAGVDGQTCNAFAVNVFSRLLTLRQQVERNEYRPQPLREIYIPKPAGGKRRLAVPAVRDRVLQTACARVLAPLLEKEFEDPSFAYRVGRSVPMAVARVAWYRDRGYQWVVDADIQTFFDEIDHTLLLEKLRRTLSDHSLLPLIDLWLAAIMQPSNDSPYLLTKGVPQGSPISPLLANLYLDDLDEALIDRGLCLVRFADDFLILCKERETAEQAMDLTEEVLDTLKLNIKQEKTRITHFEEGFRFLGVDFIRNLMTPVDEDSRPWLIPDGNELVAAKPEAEGEKPISDEEDQEDDRLAESLVESLSSAREPLSEAMDSTDTVVEAEWLHLEENPAFEPLLRSLYVTRPGLTLLKKNDRLVIADGHDVQASIPLYKLDQILIQGNQLVSTALLPFVRKAGIHLAFIDGIGRNIGAFDAQRRRNLELERAQYTRENEPDFQIMLARAFAGAKIHNQRGLLRRHNRRRNIPEIQEAEQAMATVADKLVTAKELNKIRGIEGAAAHAYFKAMKRLIPEHWGFPGRRRRPPTDPFNVLLSYGYGVLFNTLRTLIERRGLIVWLGSLHSSDGRNPALASDLVEEFRAPIVDAVALNVVLNKLNPEDFIYDAGAELPCQLCDLAKKQYLTWLQNKFRSQLLHPRSRLKLDYHRLLQKQIWHYAEVVLGKEPVYHPYHAR